MQECHVLTSHVHNFNMNFITFLVPLLLSFFFFFFLLLLKKELSSAFNSQEMEWWSPTNSYAENVAFEVPFDISRHLPRNERDLWFRGKSLVASSF